MSYFNGQYQWITTEYNTGMMKQPDGAWANDDQSTPIDAPGPLPDRSVANNPLQVIGQVTRPTFECNPDFVMALHAVRLDEVNYLQGTVQAGAQVVAWEYVAEPDSSYCWSFRRDITEFYNATLNGTALEIKGLPGGSSAALIRVNNVPVTEEELNAIEINEGRILNGIPTVGVADEGKTLVDCRFNSLRNMGYNGQVNDMEMDWLVDNGADPAIGSLNDRWQSMLIFQGFSPEIDYQYNDAWYALLGSRGYTQGHIHDRELAFWCAGGII